MLFTIYSILFCSLHIILLTPYYSVYAILFTPYCSLFSPYYSVHSILFYCLHIILFSILFFPLHIILFIPYYSLFTLNYSIILCLFHIIYYYIFCCNMFIFACPIIAKSQCWLFALRTNTGQISVFALKYRYLPSYIGICPHISVFAP